MQKQVGQYRFDMTHMLGRGSYGVVYRGKHKSGFYVAIKVLDKRQLNEESMRQLVSEIEAMKELQHENIVRLLDYYETANNIYIVSEYCDGGDLRDMIRNGKQNCKTVMEVLKQILNGYKQLQMKSILHRDIKPANILLHHGQVKLCDFGFAKKVDFEKDMMMSIAGTPLYMAPQVILRQPYTSKCDIWSLGMILYELLFQQAPIKATNLIELQEQTSIPIVVPKLEDPLLQTIIQSCLQVNENQRISWEEIYAMITTNQKEQQIIDQDDYYMRQIDNYANPQEIQVQQQSDYTKLILQSYLNNSFEVNYQIMCNQLTQVKCFYNFCLFIYSQLANFKSDLLTSIYNQLTAYAQLRLMQLEQPVFLKESAKFLQTDLWQEVLQKVYIMKNNFMDKFKPITIELDIRVLIQQLDLAREQIQQTQISHSKLCFIYMSKLIISYMIAQRDHPFQFIQVTDIQCVENLSDQELIYKIGTI